ncbi:hypothetical protein F5Y16DRAFT_366411 [Xylariaceae sp. FL0255]|nr:hypothetical protein F5Y16DRAFT_366411 [Xylariaceae sp. FL0255]
MSLNNTRSATRALSNALSSTSRARASTLSRTTAATSASPYPLPPSATASSARPPPRSAVSASVASPTDLSPLWFNSSLPQFDIPGPGNDGLNGPESERKVKLGKTLRILQERLPSLLQSPLPQEILSPNISLHLFPSTHPYLPTVTGRVAYIAALWTSPIAWNRVPIIGNVQLEILSERMVHQPLHFSPRRPGAYGEQLVVKWRTANKSSSSSKSESQQHSEGGGLSLTEQGEQNLDAHLRGSQAGGANKKTFTGLFVFEFDKDGRVISHTIEHVDQKSDWEKGVGARVVGLTDWLLGGIKGNTGGLPAFCRISGRKCGPGQR